MSKLSKYVKFMDDIYFFLRETGTLFYAFTRYSNAISTNIDKLFWKKKKIVLKFIMSELRKYVKFMERYIFFS